MRNNILKSVERCEKNLAHWNTVLNLFNEPEHKDFQLYLLTPEGFQRYSEISGHVHELRNNLRMLKMLALSQTNQAALYGGDEIGKRVTAARLLSRAIARVWEAEGEKMTPLAREVTKLLTGPLIHLAAEIESMRRAGLKPPVTIIPLTDEPQSPEEKQLADQICAGIAKERDAWRAHAGL